MYFGARDPAGNHGAAFCHLACWCGILEDRPRDRSRITSYLGRAKAMFDNVRGEGYGLREWRTPSG
jgi:hypothetical protein